MDNLKIKSTIQAAQKYSGLLEDAIKHSDHRTIGAMLYNLNYELRELDKLTERKKHEPTCNHSNQPGAK